LTLDSWTFLDEVGAASGEQGGGTGMPFRDAGYSNAGSNGWRITRFQGIRPKELTDFDQGGMTRTITAGSASLILVLPQSDMVHRLTQ
jgi:hypothetical protein